MSASEKAVWWRIGRVFRFESKLDRMGLNSNSLLESLPWEQTLLESADYSRDLQESFDELRRFVSVYDPISLLSQLVLTFMFVPQEEFQPESSGVVTWQRHIEFLTATSLAQPYPPGRSKAIDGAVLSQVEMLLEAYFTGVSRNLVFQSTNAGKLSEQEMLLRQARIESLYVRGDEYPHQYRTFARGLYGQHDAWFREHLGFTIAEAVKLSEAIAHEYEERFNRSLDMARSEARRQSGDLIATGQIDDTQRRNIESSIACRLHFGNSEVLLGFTVEELSRISGISIQTSQLFLDRMSQEFGYRNSSFPAPFTDPLTAPWDFNTLNERPIVRRGTTYWLFVLPLLNSALQSTFYFDILKDDEYRPRFEKAIGRSLENMTAECLSRVFSREMTLLNPHYPNGEEMADVLVLHDHKLLLFQCKSKKLTHAARIGTDYDALRADIKRAVADAFRQGIRARDYLQANRKAAFTTAKGQFNVDMDQVNGLYLICITSTLFRNLAARLANTNSTLGLFANDEYPWSLSLGDLDIVTQVLTTPSQFLHYLLRRIQVERTPFEVHADEMDFLGFYLSHGLDLETDDFKGFNDVSLSGFSDDVDRWVHERFVLGTNVDPPRPVMPPGFSDFLADIERTGIDYRTDCEITLLECSPGARKRLMETITKIKESSTQDKKLHSFSVVQKDGKRGISFVALSAGGNQEQVFMQAAAFAMPKKYQSRCDYWTGFGWDIESQRSVDAAIFLAQPWTFDEGMERMVKEKVRPGPRIEF